MPIDKFIIKSHFCLILKRTQFSYKQTLIFETILSQMWLLFLVFEVMMAQTDVSPIDPESISELPYEFANLQNHLNPSTILTLPAFTLSEIWLDFRHIQLFESPAYWQVKLFTTDNESLIGKLGQMSTILTNVKGRATRYSIFTTKCTPQAQVEIKFRIGLYINLIYLNYWKYFVNTVSIKAIQSNFRSSTESKEFLWVVNNLDQINLPFNPPDVKQNFYLNRIMEEQISPNASPYNKTQSLNLNDYWSSIDTFASPYIPYFSNCANAGPSIYLMKQTQRPQWCNLVPVNSTVPINELLFGMSPYADSCTIKFQCSYDEDYSVQPELPYWQTLPSGINLMQITKEKIKSSDYVSDSSASYELVNCVIEESQGNNQSDRFPTTVELTLGYYQVTSTDYHLISCKVAYGLYADASQGLGYNLTIIKKPLNHTYILIAFGFNSHVYIIAFILIGLISNLQNIMLGLYHYVANRNQRKGPKVKIYFQVMKGMFHGALSAIIPFLGLIAIANIIMSGTIFNTEVYHYTQNSKVNPIVFWDLLNSQKYPDYMASQPTQLRAGRHGIALFAISAFILYFSSDRFIGFDQVPQAYKNFSFGGYECLPEIWLKGRFILATIIYIMIQLLMMYFAYTQLFSDNIWAFIVFTKLMQMVLQQLTMSFLGDISQCFPMRIITDFTSYLNTLAANDFYDFMFSFLIDVALTMCQRAYISSLQNIVTEKLKEKIAELSAYIENIINDEEEEQKQASKEDDIGDNDEEDKEVYIAYGTADISFDETQEDYNQCASEVSDDENEAIYKRQLADVTQAKLKGEVRTEVLYEHLEEEENQRIELNNTMLEFTTDMFNMPLALILQPFAILVLWLTFSQSQILNNYLIPQKFTSIFLLSAVFIGIFTIINMVVLFFLLQNYHGLSIQQYISKMLQRFDNRKAYWKPDEGDIDTDFELPLRSANNYCLSSQFYFILTLYVSSMFLMIVGICTIISQNYNPFSDYASIIVIGFWGVFTFLYWHTFRFFGKKINIWDYKRFYGEKEKKVHPKDVSEKNQDKDKQSFEKKEQKRDSIEPDCDSQNVTITNFLKKEQRQSKEQMFDLARKASEDLSQSSFPLASSNIITPKPKLDKPIDVRLQGFSDKVEEMREIQTRLKTICKKLQPRFEEESFRLEYAIRNKDYIKKHIEKIISSVDHLPQIPEEVMNYDNQSSHEEQQTSKKIVLSDQTRNFLMLWLTETQKDKDSRKLRGMELQKGVKRCKFCYSNWGVYFGYGGICLKCNQELANGKEE